MENVSQLPLALDDYKRYGRQMILDNFGLSGESLKVIVPILLNPLAQLKLQSASVVVVGAGGLGCPALQYLAAAGVGMVLARFLEYIPDAYIRSVIGRIGIIDHDRVEVSNLQRQILHNEQTVGMYKTESAAKAILR